MRGQNIAIVIIILIINQLRPKKARKPQKRSPVQQRSWHQLLF